MENTKSSQKAKVANLLSIVLLSFVIPVWGVLACVTVKIQMLAQEPLETFGGELPFLTDFLISISPTAYSIIFAFGILLLLVKEIFIKDKLITLAINGFSALVPIVFVLLFVISLWLPQAGCSLAE